MKNTLIERIEYYCQKEKFWLNCFADTGNRRFFQRAMKFKSKAEVLQDFVCKGVTGLSLKQVNMFNSCAHAFGKRQLNLFERGDDALSNMREI